MLYERQQLIADLEDLVLHFGDTSKPESFNPHEVQDAAKRLIRHYMRLRRPDDVKRLNEVIARGFEHFAGLGDAMLAAVVLQTLSMLIATPDCPRKASACAF